LGWLAPGVIPALYAAVITATWLAVRVQRQVLQGEPMQDLQQQACSQRVANLF
jgi:hypothetical protein